MLQNPHREVGKILQNPQRNFVWASSYAAVEGGVQKNIVKKRLLILTKKIYTCSMSILVFKQLCYMMVVVLVAFVFSKKFKFGKEEISFASRTLLYLVNPCMLLSSFDIPYDSNKIKGLAVMIGLCLLVHLAMMVAACIFIRSRTPEGKELDGIDRVGVIFTNSGFIGIPLINGVLGREGVFYLMGYLVNFNILLWIFAPLALGCKFDIKKIIFNPNVIAVTAGFVLFCIPGTLPDLLAKPVGYIGQMNTALSMILLGMIFADFKKGEVKHSLAIRAAWTCLVRLVICPLAALAVIALLSGLLAGFEDGHLMTVTAYIAALCPAGMSITSLAVVFKKDAHYAGFIVALTSALCVLGTPALIYLAQLLGLM